jgi:hypothetical protein
MDSNITASDGPRPTSPAEPDRQAVLVEIAAAIEAQGYAFVPGERMAALLSCDARREWPAFAQSWDRLVLDAYMADGGRYRKRRHATFAIMDGAVTRNAHRPHFQSRTYNSLNGGIQRWFEPVETQAAENAAAVDLLDFCQILFSRLEGPSPRAARHIEMHQFRIEPEPAGAGGQPTPEGVHRDGVEWVCVLLIDRVNLERGVTTIHGMDGTTLGAFTLQHPFDAVFLDDRRVAHGVTPVVRIEPDKPAYRDVLVVTLDAPRP